MTEALRAAPATFASFNLSTPLVNAISIAGYETPTPIQRETIPQILNGHDVMGLAQTGTGKTAAFLLPIINRLLVSLQAEKAQGTTKHRPVRVLILAPTRELASQIYDSAKLFSVGTSIRCTTIYGGMSMSNQIRELKRGIEIVIGCPGRVLDHLQQRTITFSNLDVLVLDEADQMFDMGFLPTIKKILKALPQKRQSLMFSATMPKEVRGLAMEVLTNPVSVQVDRGAPATTVSHAIYPVSQNLKTKLVLELLNGTKKESVLVFTRTKHRAKQLAKTLTNAGHATTCLQGNLSQARRREAMEGFRKGKYEILVATDIAARGIDVSSISHVINFDIPNTVEAYTHRIGRTGRAAKTGDAFTLVTREDESMVRSIERVLGARLERRTLPDFDYNGRDLAPVREGAYERGNRSGSPFGERGATSRSGQSRGRQFHRQEPRAEVFRTDQPRATRPPGRITATAFEQSRARLEANG